MTDLAVGLDVLDEYAGAQLGDLRRHRRLMKLVDAANQEPAASFPMVARDDAALEATYRFFNNAAVNADGILAGHYEQTSQRAARHEMVVAIHDTSNFEYGGEKLREGLGPVRRKKQGFLGHVALIVSPERDPLGVASLQILTRPANRSRNKTLSGKRWLEDPARESRRWFAGVEQAEERLGQHKRVVHVMDREGDSYELLTQLKREGRHFVIRASHDRTLADDGLERLSDALQSTTTVVERDVLLSRRSDHGRTEQKRRIHPSRSARVARLSISATKVSAKRAGNLPKQMFPDSLELHVVHVREVETHGDDEPVEWILLTSEPISSASDLEQIVDIYRARWTVEEYFKALKTGCALEKRQLGSKHALVNALALYIPIAWRLLRLRTLARSTKDVLASEALTPQQLEVLVATSRVPLPSPLALTARQALTAVARLGGHVKNNGEPGWLVLGRGYDRLLTMEVAWQAALRSDQS